MTIYHPCDRAGDFYEDTDAINLDGLDDDDAYYESWLQQEVEEWVAEYEARLQQQSLISDEIPFPELLKAAKEVKNEEREDRN